MILIRFYTLAALALVVIGQDDQNTKVLNFQIRKISTDNVETANKTLQQMPEKTDVFRDRKTRQRKEFNSRLPPPDLIRRPKLFEKKTIDVKKHITIPKRVSFIKPTAIQIKDHIISKKPIIKKIEYINEPKIVELPATTNPMIEIFENSNKKLEKSLSKITLSKKKTVESKKMKKDSMIELTKQKINDSRVENPNTFSYTFVPNENPLRSDENTKEKAQLPTKGINSLPSYSKLNDLDELQTSESKQRSKIEIKEVNGTLFEYEYIYYYDDEPTYDTQYDTQIADFDYAPETLSSAPPPKKTTTTSTTPKPVAIITTTPSPAPTRPSQRIRARRPSSKVEEITRNEVTSRQNTRQRGTSSRQTSRGRGTARVIENDNVVSENNAQNVNVEDAKLPQQTRFPPRPTPATIDIPAVEDILTATLEEELLLDDPLLDEVLDYQEFTTIEPEPQTDKSANNLYALSRAVDADYTESTTIDPTLLEDDTQSPLDYYSLYDYDLTLSDLVDVSTTPDYEIFTEEPTTTPLPTTSTTTTPTTTTTTTTTPEPTTKTSSRLRGSRIRGFPRRRGPVAQNTESEDPVKEVTTTTTTAPKSRNRFSRLNLRNRQSSRTQEKTEEPTKTNDETEVSKSEVITQSSISKPRGRIARPRPNFKNRFSKKKTNEKTIEISTPKPVDEKVEEIVVKEAPKRVSRPRTRPRGRRPPSFRNKSSRKQATVEKETAAEMADKTDAQVDAPVEQASQPEKVPIVSTQQNTNRHRFRLPNRRGNLKNKPTPKHEIELESTKQNNATVSSSDVSIPENKKSIDIIKTRTPTRRVSNRRGRQRPNRLRGAQKKVEPTEIEPVDQNAEQVNNEQIPTIENVEVTEIKEQSPTPARRDRRPQRKPRRRNRVKLQPKAHVPEEVVEEEIPAPAIVEETPVDPFASIVESTVQQQQPQTESEVVPVPEDATDSPFVEEPTTEKLTRRELLARKRNEKLG